MKQVEVLQLRADNDRMQRTITRNGLLDDDNEFTEHSPDVTSSATSSLQKKLSLGDPTTFGLSSFSLHQHHLFAQNGRCTCTGNSNALNGKRVKGEGTV